MLSATPPTVDSNSAATTDQIQKKKKKKRAREEDPSDTHEKKKKHRHEESSSTPAPVESDASVKSKKKKKDKSKAKESPLSEQTDAEIEANSQASAAALLSAIVAASVNNPEPPQAPPPPVYDPSLVPPPPPGQSFEECPPQMPFGFGLPPPPFDPNGAHPPNAFSAPLPPAANAFSELAFGSNDELLRALQELDMSKIASVLKSLGDVSSGAAAQTFAPQLSFMPSQMSQILPPAVNQFPAHSNMILGVAPKATIATPGGHKRTIDMSLPGNEQHTNPDHAHLLATKWLNASKLAELVRDEGLVYKKGKFSAIEEQQLRSAIENYQHSKDLTGEQIKEIIFAKNDRNKDNAFWSEITAAVPLRPIIAVYHHVRRTYHPLNKQGAWQDYEDDALKQAVTDLGQQWEKVSARVGRRAADCRDRYRNHIVNREIRVMGPWSKEEEDKLIRIVTDMTVKQGKDPDNDVFWGKVSELMGGTRGRQQCRIKWTDALSKTVKNEGQKPRWSQQDAYILVHKIDSLNVRDDTEIDWKLISDPDWNLWSAHTLQRRWLTLKKSVKGYEDMTHQGIAFTSSRLHCRRLTSIYFLEIMDILRIKKAHLPPPPPQTTKKKKERKIVSAASVTEPSDPKDDEGAAGSRSSATGKQPQGQSRAAAGDSTDSSED
ncbi:hypothetical protein CVT26_010726 [Gymnopilus dilepis]|uniref:Myb-like domain-containing protein n=1 Tax=Gymnopilus dilepis TaxID=231916 RepID=A0A409VI53_9AGAR|nr:hypothetical protein CVT26_010726 [Gymnopilus dilepis]